MRTGKPTEQDYKNQFIACQDCDNHVVRLDAGTETDDVKCEKCGCYAPLKSDFIK